MLAQMRHAGPVVLTKFPIIGKVWLVTTYDAVCAMLKDQECFVREGRNAGKRWWMDLEWWMSKLFRAPSQNMLSKDEPDHRRLRNLVEQAFARRSIEGMRSRIETITDELLDEAAARGDAGGVIDIAEFAQQLPLAVISELLGLPDEDRAKFTQWAAGTTSVSSLTGLLRLLPNMFRINRYFREQLNLCRQKPREGLISLLVQAEIAGDCLNEDELTAMVYLLLFAGHVTTVELIANGLFTLLEHPDQKAELLQDWTKIESAVEEMLRYRAPVPFAKPRLTSKDLVFHGQPLRRGQRVLAVLASANTDPARFDDPERFDINRHPNQHVSFGAGIHVCLGLKLARLEARVAIQRLLTRYPNLDLAVPHDQVPWSRGGFRTFKSLPVRLQG
ncbi:MAG: cytochrome P450 [Gemmataceae bacterium]